MRDNYDAPPTIMAGHVPAIRSGTSQRQMPDSGAAAKWVRFGRPFFSHILFGT